MKRASLLAAAVILGAGLAVPALAHDLKGAKGEHVMSGTITKIDHDSGKLSLDAEGTMLDLHFPPPAIKDMKEGDRVAVEMSISRNVPAGTAAHHH